MIITRWWESNEVWWYEPRVGRCK